VKDEPFADGALHPDRTGLAIENLSHDREGRGPSPGCDASPAIRPSVPARRSSHSWIVASNMSGAAPRQADDLGHLSGGVLPRRAEASLWHSDGSAAASRHGMHPKGSAGDDLRAYGRGRIAGDASHPGDGLGLRSVRRSFNCMAARSGWRAPSAKARSFTSPAAARWWPARLPRPRREPGSESGPDEQFRPDVVFSDVAMPEMDGFELAHAMPARHISLIFRSSAPASRSSRRTWPASAFSSSTTKEQIRKLLSTWLTRHGYEVTVAKRRLGGSQSNFAPRRRSW